MLQKHKAAHMTNSTSTHSWNGPISVSANVTTQAQNCVLAKYDDTFRGKLQYQEKQWNILLFGITGV
jgi:hypothetical protein